MAMLRRNGRAPYWFFGQVKRNPHPKPYTLYPHPIPLTLYPLHSPYTPNTVDMSGSQPKQTKPKKKQKKKKTQKEITQEGRGASVSAFFLVEWL